MRAELGLEPRLLRVQSTLLHAVSPMGLGISGRDHPQLSPKGLLCDAQERRVGAAARQTIPYQLCVLGQFAYPLWASFVR